MSKVVNVLLAAAGGFVAGVLLAPKSGKETRQDIMDKTNEFKTKAQDGIEEVKKGADHVKDEVVEGVRSVKNIAEDAHGDAARTAERAKGVIDDRANAVKDEVESTSRRTRRATREQQANSTL